MIGVWATGAPYLDATLARLAEDEAAHRVLHGDAADLVDAELVDVEVLIVGGAPVDAAFLDRLPVLRLVVRAGVGVDRIDLTAADACGVVVTNVADYGTQEVADHTLLLALAVVRRLRAAAAQVDTPWAQAQVPDVLRLAGATCGLVGLGRIGAAVATRMRALGLAVIAHDPHVDGERFDALGVSAATLDEVWAGSDLISLHAPAVAENRHLVDAAAFAAMRRRPVLVNTARGELVDTVALERALADGRVSGAGLDVLEDEAQPWHHATLLARDDVVVTPHVAWFSVGARTQLGRTAAEIALGFLTTGDVSHRIAAPITPDSADRP